MLLLIAPQDRQYMIYLGKAWSKESSDQVQKAIRDVLIPGLKSGETSPAILTAVQMLNDRSRKELQAYLKPQSAPPIEGK